MEDNVLSVLPAKTKSFIPILSSVSIICPSTLVRVNEWTMYSRLAKFYENDNKTSISNNSGNFSISGNIKVFSVEFEQDSL